jgi:hypothetical protein
MRNKDDFNSIGFMGALRTSAAGSGRTQWVREASVRKLKAQGKFAI